MNYADKLNVLLILNNSFRTFLRYQICAFGFFSTNKLVQCIINLVVRANFILFGFEFLQE